MFENSFAPLDNLSKKGGQCNVNTQIKKEHRKSMEFTMLHEKIFPGSGSEPHLDGRIFHRKYWHLIFIDDQAFQLSAYKAGI